MTRPFDPDNREVRPVMTPDGRGDVVAESVEKPGEFGVKMGQQDKRKQTVRPMRWYRAEEMEEVEE